MTTTSPLLNNLNSLLDANEEIEKKKRKKAAADGEKKKRQIAAVDGKQQRSRYVNTEREKLSDESDLSDTREHVFQIIENIIDEFGHVSKEETELLVNDLIPKIKEFHAVENKLYDNAGRSKVEDHDERERQYSRLSDWDFGNTLTSSEDGKIKRAEFRKDFGSCVKRKLVINCRDRFGVKYLKQCYSNAGFAVTLIQHLGNGAILFIVPFSHKDAIFCDSLEEYHDVDLFRLIVEEDAYVIIDSMLVHSGGGRYHWPHEAKPAAVGNKKTDDKVIITKALDEQGKREQQGENSFCRGCVERLGKLVHDYSFCECVHCSNIDSIGDSDGTDWRICPNVLEPGRNICTACTHRNTKKPNSCLGASVPSIKKSKPWENIPASNKERRCNLCLEKIKGEEKNESAVNVRIHTHAHFAHANATKMVGAERFGCQSGNSSKKEPSFKTVNFGSKKPCPQMTQKEREAALTSEGCHIKDIRVGRDSTEYGIDNFMKYGFAVCYKESNSEKEKDDGAEAAIVQSILMKEPFKKENMRTGSRSFLLRSDFPNNPNDAQQRCINLFNKHESESKSFLSDVLWPALMQQISVEGEDMNSMDEKSDSKLLYNMKKMGPFDEQKLHVDFDNPNLYTRNTY